MLVAAAAFGAGAKSFDLPTTQWVTPNPPSNEDICGRVCVVEFWATWCPPCREQIPHMKSMAKKYEDRNVVFMGLSEDKSIGDVRKFVETKKINYHIGMDNGLADRLGVNGIPTVFVVTHTGKILWSGHPGDIRFEEAVQSAVKAAPKPMLSGVDMGRYSYLRIKLCGGRNFAKAYSELETSANRCDCSEKSCACKVFGIVNSKLREKITAAEQVQDKDPRTALLMYQEIIDNYGGINLTRQIEPTYQRLQKTTAQMGRTTNAQAKAAN